MNAVQRVAGLERHNLVPAQFAEQRAQLVRSVATGFEIIMHRLLDAGDRAAKIGLARLIVQIVHGRVGQIIGALIGAAAAELWAFDGILFATLLLQAIALMPLSRLRRFEFQFQPSPGSGPDPAVATVDLSVTRAYRADAADEDGRG